jgi:hypothetical protein
VNSLHFWWSGGWRYAPAADAIRRRDSVPEPTIIPPGKSLAHLPEISVLDSSSPTASALLQKRLEKIIRRMRTVQQSIQASRQPASRLELMELGDLGREYGRIVAQLADLQSDDAG